MPNHPSPSSILSLGWRRNGLSPGVGACRYRQFSTSPSYASRAVFAETDNSELNGVLKHIQEKIILPAYLPEKQRKIVFDLKMRPFLKQNPIVIHVDDLEHTFSTINKFKDVENSKKVLNRALSLMNTAQDWSNLEPLLAGYRRAGIKLMPHHWGKIVRVAGTRGQINAILECAKQARQTALRLINLETTLRVLAFVNDSISESNGDLPEARKALGRIELVLDLLQRPEHQISTRRTRDRLHFSRLVRGLALFARASVVKAMQQNGEPVEQTLADLKEETALLGTLWQDALGKDLAHVAEFAELSPSATKEAETKSSQDQGSLNGRAYVQILSQNIKGIAMAREVIGDGAISLAPVEDALEKHLEAYVRNSRGRKDDWEKEYEKVVGRRPNWPGQ